VVALLVVAQLALVAAARQGDARPPIAALEPKDDGAADPGFVEFRRRVRQTSRVCTEEALRQVLGSDGSAESATADPGKAEFWRVWGQAPGGLRALCRAIDRAIALGAVREGSGRYCVPYVTCEGGTPDLLPFGRYLMGVSRTVRIRTDPDPSAATLVEAAYPVLIDCSLWRDACHRHRATEPPDGWAGVRLGEVVGFVSSDEIRSQHEAFLRIRRLRVGWRITEVSAAD
jgi:hypothetical protein